MKWKSYANKKCLMDQAQFVVKVLEKTTDRKLSNRKKIKDKVKYLALH